MITNPKITKVNVAIEKAKAQILDFQGKLRDLEKQKMQFENEEIVAMFRREKLNEDEFAELLQTGRNKTAQPTQQKHEHLQTRKEETFDGSEEI